MMHDNNFPVHLKKNRTDLRAFEPGRDITRRLNLFFFFDRKEISLMETDVTMSYVFVIHWSRCSFVFLLHVPTSQKIQIEKKPSQFVYMYKKNALALYYRA